ncbi:hypothetical protein LDENG_00207540 [Lucifuga dentata]|nr:hypothetical protein LDENG_00207540 [Lucifuga dentata]
MPPVLLLAVLILALSISVTASESAELRFQGQTDFIVKETSESVVRLIVERVGDPVNVTALVLLEGDDTDDFISNNAAALLLSTESNQTIFITVKNDELPEADETFTFNLKLQLQASASQSPTVLILPLSVLNLNPND